MSLYGGFRQGMTRADFMFWALKVSLPQCSNTLLQVLHANLYLSKSRKVLASKYTKGTKINSTDFSL